ncbi:hypothetical protein TSMEX_005231 [Taenia solium]|eukprot:TsM_001187200 transcript=TsM_001187200 gene=TsM_001187200
METNTRVVLYDGVGLSDANWKNQVSVKRGEGNNVSLELCRATVLRAPGGIRDWLLFGEQTGYPGSDLGGLFFIRISSQHVL